MKARIIINVDLPYKGAEESAIYHVQKVMAEGKISETRGIKHYCLYTVFDDGHEVSCRPTRSGSVRFDVRKKPRTRD